MGPYHIVLANMAQAFSALPTSVTIPAMSREQTCENLLVGHILTTEFVYRIPRSIYPVPTVTLA